MGFSEPKVKLRLCEQLRIHAPHIFTKSKPNRLEPPQSKPSNFSSVPQPPFTPNTGFRPQPPPVLAETEPNFTSVKPEPPQSNNSIFSRTNLVWQGNLARNGKKLTETLAIKISGQCSLFLNASLETINITHRLKWEEASKNVPLAVFSIHSSNNLKIEPFVEYIEYFKTKNRIGVSPLGNDHNIYICAPGNPLFDKHMPEGLSTPTLIGIVVSVELSNTNQSARVQQSNDDWLTQLNTLTAMVGTKK